MSSRLLLLGLAGLSACAAGTSRTESGGGPSARIATTRPPALIRASTAALTYPARLARMGLEGRVVLRLAVAANGRVDTQSTQIISSTNHAFTRDLPRQLASWKLRPAAVGHRAVPGSLVVTLLFRVELCAVLGTHERHTVFPDSAPPIVAVTGCDEATFHNVVNPKYIKTTNAVLSGVWSPGFEDGFFQPCRGAKLPTAPGLGNNRLLSVEWNGVDTARVPVGQMQRALRPAPGKDKRYFVTWEGRMTGPQPSGHMGMAAFTFRPTRLIVLEWWEDRSCPLS